MYRTSGTIKPVTGYCESQIHARNPKSPAEKDLLSPCGRLFLHAVMRLLLGSGTEDDIFLVGDACAELKGV